jgi:hypothetical protein
LLSDEGEDESNLEDVIHPDITKHFKNELEVYMNRYFIKTYGK